MLGWGYWSKMVGVGTLGWDTRQGMGSGQGMGFQTEDGFQTWDDEVQDMG